MSCSGSPTPWRGPRRERPMPSRAAAGRARVSSHLPPRQRRLATGDVALLDRADEAAPGAAAPAQTARVAAREPHAHAPPATGADRVAAGPRGPETAPRGRQLELPLAAVA